MHKIKGEDKTKEQLINELIELRQRIAELKKSEAERKQMDESLKDIEARYKALFDRSLYCVYIHDFEGRFIDANEAALNLMGYTREEIPCLKISSFLEKDQLSTAFKIIEEIKQTGSQKNPIEFKLRKKNGDYVWVETEASLIYREGKPYGILGIARDITERKRVEESLRKSEEQYRTMIETMNEGLSVVDQNGFITFVNRQFCEMTGYLRDELLGCHETVLLDTENRRRLKVREIARKKGDATPYEITLTRKDGGKVHTLVAPRPIFGENVKFKGSLGIFTDITELKQAEEKLISYQERLRSFTLELTLVEDRERRHIAVELQDHIGQTLAYCKIKLKNLRESLSLVDLRESLDEIYALIDQTIQYTKSLTIELSTPILHEAGLEAAVKWLGEQFQKQHGLVFHFEDDQRLRPLSDEARILLFQIVRELLINVIKHAKARSVKVSIQRDYKNILINVKDDGIGFDTSKIDSHESKTAGFGLFSILERVKYMGGQLKVESKLGYGTQVTMIVPLRYAKRRE